MLCKTKVWLKTYIRKKYKSFVLFPYLSGGISQEIGLNLELQNWYKLGTVFCSVVDKHKKSDGKKIWKYIK